MKNLMNYSLFKESKNYSTLYHILNYEKLKYVIDNNHLKPYRASNGMGISVTRDKMMNGYLGDGAATFFKLELDGEKISQKYKIKPFSYKSMTGVRFDEREELIKTKKGIVSDLDKYVTKLIIIKSSLERLKQRQFRDDNSPTDFYTTAGTRLGTIPEILKYVVENSPYEIYVQDGSQIKKDDAYIQSIINYDLYKVNFKYDIWYRGYFKHDKLSFGLQDTIIDSGGNRYKDWAVGDIYPSTINVKSREELDLNAKEIIIDGEKCKPYIIKFRITEKGYYLEEAKPLSWLDSDKFFENEPEEMLNEWVNNKKLTKHHISNMIHNIQKRSKNKITPRQFKKDFSSHRSYEVEFLDIIDHKILEKILKQHQKSLLEKGILISYKKSEGVDFDFDADTLDMTNHRPSGKMDFKIFIKDMYTMRVKPPKYIIHYSKPEHRDSILKNGLQVKEFNEGNWTIEGNSLYYPPTIFAMMNETDTWGSDKYVIDTEGLDNKWWRDLNFHNDTIDTDKIMTFTNIPAEHIRLCNKHVSDYTELFENYDILQWRSGKGSTKIKDKIYYEPNNPKSPGARIMLQQDLMDKDPDRFNINSMSSEELSYARASSNKRYIIKRSEENNGILNCDYCGKEVLYDKERKKWYKDRVTIDHKNPMTKGGHPISYKNKALCCDTCNGDKDDMNWKEWVKVMKETPEKYKGKLNTL